MKLCSVTTNNTNDEVLKIVREKIVRSKLKEFVVMFLKNVEKNLKRQELMIFYDFYHFIRMLESVLDKGDLKPIFERDGPFSRKIVYPLKSSCTNINHFSIQRTLESY